MEQKKVTTIKRFDNLGVVLSTICLFHCIFFPLLALIAPTATVALNLSTDVTHVILFVLIFPVTLFAFLSGYKKHKKSALSLV